MCVIIGIASNKSVSTNIVNALKKPIKEVIEEVQEVDFEIA